MGLGLGWRRVSSQFANTGAGQLCFPTRWRPCFASKLCTAWTLRQGFSHSFRVPLLCFCCAPSPCLAPALVLLSGIKARRHQIRRREERGNQRVKLVLAQAPLRGTLSSLFPVSISGSDPAYMVVHDCLGPLFLRLSWYVSESTLVESFALIQVQVYTWDHAGLFSDFVYVLGWCWALLSQRSTSHSKAMGQRLWVFC